MKEIIIDDKRTVEDAIEEGLLRLNTTRENVEIETISAGGLFSKPKVRLTVKETAGTRAKNFAEKLLEMMNISGNIELKETAEEAVLNISGTDAGSIIGYRGEVLDAVQYLSSVVANLNSDKSSFKRITVDSENYRNRRNDTLENLADRMVNKAVTSGRRVALEPMNPYERRIIHIRLQDNAEVTAHSEGEEPNRRLIIVPKNEKPYEKFSDKQKTGYNRNKNTNNNNKSGGKNYRNNYGQKPYQKSGFTHDNVYSATSGFSENDLKGGKNYTTNTKYNKD